MKTGFKNPIEGKQGKQMKSPWNFDAPAYDERSSCFVNAGTYQGVGHKQPVGSKKVTMEGKVPQGMVETMSLYPSRTTIKQDD